MRHLHRICILLATMIVPAGLAWAQAVNGTLLGTVTDSSGGTVPNAQISIKETNTGVSRTTKTGDAGYYVFPDVPPGTYAIAVEMPGFKREVRSGVDVQVNQTARVDLTLQPGNVTETVTVVAEAALLQTDRSDTNTKVDE